MGVNDDVSVTAKHLDDFIERIRRSALVVTDRASCGCCGGDAREACQYLDPVRIARSRGMWTSSFRHEFRVTNSYSETKSGSPRRGFIEPARAS